MASNKNMGMLVKFFGEDVVRVLKEGVSELTKIRVALEKIAEKNTPAE